MSTATLSEETAQELERFFLNPKSNLESDPPELSELFIVEIIKSVKSET